MSRQPLLRRARGATTRPVAAMAASLLVAGTVVLAAAPTGSAADVRSISVGDASVTEGNLGVTSLVVTLSLDGPANGDEVVHVATSEGTAMANDLDFEPIDDLTVTFESGETTAQVTVDVTADTFAEVNDRLGLAVISAANVLVADDFGLLTILNDDGVAGVPGLFGLRGSTVTASLTTNTQLLMTVSVNSLGTEQCAVEVRFTHITTTDDDFTAPLAPFDLVLPAGGAGASFDVEVGPNQAGESIETFHAVLVPKRIGSITACSNAGGSIGLGTIEPPRATKRRISISPSSALEGDSGTTAVTFQVLADGVLDGNCEYEARAVEIGSVGLVDTQTGPQIFDAGTSTDSVTFLITGDTLVEGDQQFNVTLSIVAGQAACEPGDLVGVRATVFDDDVAPPPPPPSEACVNGEKVTVTWPGVTLGRTPSSFLVRSADTLVELPEGRWSVKLTSHDPTHPGASGQNKERWGVRLYDDTGAFVDNTWFVDDLPTGQKWLTKGVGSVDVPEGGVARVRATHFLAGVSTSQWGSSQSIIPSKAVFTCTNPL